MNNVCGGLRSNFQQNGFEVAAAGGYIRVHESSKLTRSKALEIIEGAKYRGSISENRLRGDIVFTVVPYILPDFFKSDDWEKLQVPTIGTVWGHMFSQANKWCAKSESLKALIGVSSMQQFWNEMYKASTQYPAILTELGEMEPSGENKVVLDLGCGNGIPAMGLLERGYQVIALDNHAELLSLFRDNVPKEFLDTGQLKIVESAIESYAFSERVDVVVAQDSLMYVDPGSICNVMRKIHTALNAKGFFVGSFFHADSDKAAEKMAGGGYLWLLKNPNSVVALLLHYNYEIKYLRSRYGDDVVDPKYATEFIAQKRDV